MKEFLKPTLVKIILTIALFFFIGYLILAGLQDVKVSGFPLKYYGKGLMPCPLENLNCNEKVYFSLFNLVIDILFWYLISCTIIFIINKIKNEVQPK